MIKEVISSRPFVNVSGGNNFTPYINMSNVSAGMTQWNGNSNNFEVYDGSSWMTLSSNVVSVGLNNDAVGAITWVLKKMAEEMAVVELAKSNVAVKDIVDQLTEKQQQLKIVMALIKQEEKI